MFSTLDHGAYRGVDIVVDAPDRSESLEVPPSLEIAAARAAAFAVDWLMRDLAKGSLRERGGMNVQSRASPSPHGARISIVRRSARPSAPFAPSSTTCPSQITGRTRMRRARPWTF